MQKVWHAEMSQDIKQKARACLHFKPNFQFSPLYLSSSSPKLEINRSERRHSKGDGERERGKVHIEGFMKYFLDANELHILLMLEMLQKKYVCVCRIEREIERAGKWFVLYRTGSCDAPDWHSTMKQETEKKKKPFLWKCHWVLPTTVINLGAFLTHYMTGWKIVLHPLAVKREPILCEKAGRCSFFTNFLWEASQRERKSGRKQLKMAGVNKVHFCHWK